MGIARELVTLLRYELDERGLRAFTAGQAGAQKETRRTAEGVRQLGSEAARTGTLLGQLGGLVRGALAGYGITTLARVSDEWAGVEGRVGLVTDGIEEQRAALDGLYTAAQDTRQGYVGLASVFQGIARNKTELDLTNDKALKLSETIGLAMTIGGGSRASQEAALMQLSQALGTGTLRGEELNSIMEQAPRLAQAIAKAFKVPVGQLKKLGEQGKLSSKILAEGLLAQSAELRAEFERLPKTFGGALTVLGNGLGRVTDKINRATGASKRFFQATALIVDNLEDVLKALAALAGASILGKLTAAARGLGGAAGLLRRALVALPFLNSLGRMLAVATAIYYVFDDISVWFRGGHSLLGDIVGPMSDWKWLVDAVGAGLTLVKDALGGGAVSLGEWLSKWGLIAAIVAGIVLAVGAIPALILTIITAWASVFNYVKQNWDSLIADTIYNIERLGNALRDLVPAGLRNFFASAAAPGSGGIASTPVIGSGGAAFGITPAMMNRRPGSGAGGAVTNNVTTHVVATTPQPAAVAEAARRGTERGMSGAMVPNVEVAR